MMHIPINSTSDPKKFRVSHDAPFRFDRAELSGAFGDLGTLVPIVVGMILINGLSPSTVFLAFGLFYLLTGFYYRLPVPVQPLKAVGALAVAYPAVITEPVIGAAGILFGALLLLFALTGLVDKLATLFTEPVVRGIQLSLGLIFLKKGIELIVSPRLFSGVMEGNFAGSGINLAIGVFVFMLVLILLDNKKLPAALAALAVGILSGFLLGGIDKGALSLGPTAMKVTIPSPKEFWTAFIMLILPQMPLTIGNACIGTADTCSTLFPRHPALSRSRAGKFAMTMGMVNLPAGFFGAVPMCHGTGGLAAHFRFGARTGGAPAMIGIIFIIMTIAFGGAGFTVLSAIPNSVLGVLLIFAGLELCPLVRSLKTNEAYFVALLISGIALAVPNMAWAFGVGIAVDLLIRKMNIKI